MKFDDRFKLGLLYRHDANMQRSVQELFPRPTGEMRSSVCPGCKEEFLWEDRSNGHSRIWCSDKCRDRTSKHKLAMRRRAVDVPDIICRNCHKPAPANRAGTVKIFCCKACKIDWYRKQSGPSRP